MGIDVNIHELESIRDLLIKQREDIRKSLEFSESHPKLFKVSSDQIEELKIYQALSIKGVELLNDIILDFHEYGETEISVVNY